MMSPWLFNVNMDGVVRGVNAVGGPGARPAYSKCGTSTGDGTRTIACRYADIFQKREKQK